MLTDIDRVTFAPTYAGGLLTACFWTNGLWVVAQRATDWKPLDEFRRNIWRVNQAERKISIEPVFQVGPEGVVRVHTGTNPAQVDEDADETFVDRWYIICRATELAYSAISGGRQTDPENYRQQVALWAGRTNESKRTFPILENVRQVPGASQ